MPIFHDPDDPPVESSLPPSHRPPPAHQPQRPGNSRDLRDRTLLHHVHAANNLDPLLCPVADFTSPTSERKPAMLDRVELIERLKRGSSPVWQHHHGLSADGSHEPRPVSQEPPKTPQPAPNHPKSPRTSTPDPLRDQASIGLEIERPRSALHSGDFREKKEDSRPAHGPSSSTGLLATSPVAPWHHSFPAFAVPAARNETTLSFRDVFSQDSRAAARSRAVSQSSSSFVFMPPTSPLVQQSNNTDLDFSSRPNSRQSSRSPERNSRRHTFSPHSFQSYPSSYMARSATGTPAARHLQKGVSLPYQAHQPRRSLNSFQQFQPHSSPQSPYMDIRRPSITSESSPLHHAPMVGSYEESILRGRMSTTPSRPLNFVAKIGVLGKGQCKSNLRCPPHVTVPFPAVFYSYNTGNGRIADNSPSPYVGLIDLENSLPAPDEGGESNKRRRRHTAANQDQDDPDFRLSAGEEDPRQSNASARKREKKKRRSTSPKAPPGGSYRIPQQGQLQIVLKNPNKTAVKLFLVPYDLSDMEPGQKTFIRQRSYSAGPIIDMPLSSRSNLGTDCPEASLSNSDDPNDRPILRYLIHLHMCCPSKGRYFLYKSIRVVFANRVPDGKEKLRNEIQMPEPRYSAYKPSRDSMSAQSSSAAAQSTAEKSFRRRSAGFTLSQQAYDQMDGLRQHPPLPPPAVQFTGGPSPSPEHFGSPMSALQPIPFSLSRLDTIHSRPSSRDPMDLDSPFKPRADSSKNDLDSPIRSRTEAFEKLNKGDVGYGGNAFCGVGGSPVSPGTGLLARRLRGLDVHLDEDGLANVNTDGS
ncbi:hypothetical protein BS50DRAFT_486077 [Corynespora cassiicola Philippines]|uniref:Atos-like conserved domain-containing protein n=1 Tax=Corynespora cassiicola Philippines TaxID=1448308 RepID=A0A2T2P0S3_CORCC|nr:hypothetical protein BS50DRAFT_486077 [Corynespora cassiicola Philippines]